jgi:sugar lactone lactonase YvrE
MNDVFAFSSCQLGEGIFFDEVNRLLYWLDISKSMIYRKSVDDRKQHFECFNVGNKPSVILAVKSNVIEFVDKHGICRFDINNKSTEIIFENITTSHTNFRANDGVTLSNGKIIFGTMNEIPHKSSGDIFVQRNNGLEVIQGLEFFIPNTFIELNDAILISDSLTQKTYKIHLDFENPIGINLWKDFSDSQSTPDGGFLDKKGKCYIAMWGGACIDVFDKVGNHLRRIEVPVLQPTNCALVDERYLYITSAREGLTEDELLAYPMSGNVLVVDLGV